MLIWIASYPRSGNGYFREVLFRHCDQDSWSVYPSIKRLGQIDLSGDKARQIVASRTLHWVKTHEKAVRDDNPAVYLVRDGRDALVSYTWYVLKKERRLREPIAPSLFRSTMRNLIAGESPFGTWSENTHFWMARPRTAVVRFENLVREPIAELRRVLETLGLADQLAQNNVPPPSFAELQARDPLHYRKGQSGQWREEMPMDLQVLFWKRHGPAMKALGYEWN